MERGREVRERERGEREDGGQGSRLPLCIYLLCVCLWSFRLNPIQTALWLLLAYMYMYMYTVHLCKYSDTHMHNDAIT